MRVLSILLAIAIAPLAFTGSASAQDDSAANPAAARPRTGPPPTPPAPTAEPTAAPPAESPNALRMNVARHTLPNGLRIVMNQDMSVPTVAVAVYYDVGSRNEQPGRSGFAHLFEHMMFQGSANVGKMEHFAHVTNRGGSANGTTNGDRTNYFETLPSHELALGLWLEADRMRSLAITTENFENQRQVVMEERRQSYENRPYALSNLEINRLAYGDYFPYAHSTIGQMADLQAAPLTAVQEFFDQYYPPNNAVLSIAGHFEPAQAIALAEQYFGSIPSRPVPAFNPGEPAPQTAERVHSMNDPLAQLPAFHVAYPIPMRRTTDHYALEMLASVLTDGDSSRLYQKLVKDLEICQQIYSGADNRRGPDLFSFWAVLAEGHTGAEAREVIFAEVQSIATEGITERELQKAQNKLRASFIFGLQANMNRAMELAEYEMYFGNAELLRTEVDRYLAVSRADIQRVAGQYFAATNRTILDVLPVAEEAEPHAEATTESGSEGAN